MSLADSIVADTALENDLELVSRNVGDFEWIAGPRLVNPFDFVLRNPKCRKGGKRSNIRGNVRRPGCFGVKPLKGHESREIKNSQASLIQYFRPVKLIDQSTCPLPSTRIPLGSLRPVHPGKGSNKASTRKTVRLLKAVGPTLSLRPVISRTVSVPFSPIRKGGIAAFGGCRGQRLNAPGSGCCAVAGRLGLPVLTSEGGNRLRSPRGFNVAKNAYLQGQSQNLGS